MSNYKRILSEAQNNLPQKELHTDYLKENMGALASIVKNAQDILSSLADENIENHLTEAWLQGKISETQDYMETIHDFVKYSRVEAEDSNMTPASLWENIRKKKEREGKKYKPAKPGDKDRPKKDAWKKAQSGPSEKQKKALDKNKDGKITKEDFEMLRKKK
jgi:hypothetical protein